MYQVIIHLNLNLLVVALVYCCLAAPTYPNLQIALADLTLNALRSQSGCALPAILVRLAAGRYHDISGAFSGLDGRREGQDDQPAGQSWGRQQGTAAE